MEEAGTPSVRIAVEEQAMSETKEGGLASEVFLFLHAGGLPIDAVADQLSALRCFGRVKAHFDLDGPMWSAVAGGKASGFEDYLVGLIDRTDKPSGVLSALIDYRDLLWLEQRPIFLQQLRQRLRVVRLAYLDPALQAFRRQRAWLREDRAKPGFAEIARDLVGIEEADDRGAGFCRRHGLPKVKLWVEDLARPGVPALRGLLDRWSIPLAKDGRVLAIAPPSLAELETVAAFRREAAHRHWSHALLPHQS